MLMEEEVAVLAMEIQAQKVEEEEAQQERVIQVVKELVLPVEDYLIMRDMVYSMDGLLVMEIE